MNAYTCVSILKSLIVVPSGSRFKYYILSNPFPQRDRRPAKERTNGNVGKD